MATQPEYSAAANAILAVLKKDINEEVPSFFEAKVLAIAPALAGECAKAGVDALDAFRAKQPKGT